MKNRKTSFFEFDLTAKSLGTEFNFVWYSCEVTKGLLKISEFNKLQKNLIFLNLAKANQ